LGQRNTGVEKLEIQRRRGLLKSYKKRRPTGTNLSAKPDARSGGGSQMKMEYYPQPERKNTSMQSGYKYRVYESKKVPEILI